MAIAGVIGDINPEEPGDRLPHQCGVAGDPSGCKCLDLMAQGSLAALKRSASGVNAGASSLGRFLPRGVGICVLEVWRLLLDSTHI